MQLTNPRTRNALVALTALIAAGVIVPFAASAAADSASATTTTVAAYTPTTGVGTPGSESYDSFRSWHPGPTVVPDADYVPSDTVVDDSSGVSPSTTIPADMSAPVVGCEDLAFTSNSEDMATAITGFNTDCNWATTVARDASAIRGATSGPSYFVTGQFRCIAGEDTGTALPYSLVSCTNGVSTVTFERS